jgi:hypothetical protein
MPTVGFLVSLEAAAGHEGDVADFLADAAPRTRGTARRRWQGLAAARRYRACTQASHEAVTRRLEREMSP